MICKSRKSRCDSGVDGEVGIGKTIQEIELVKYELSANSGPYMMNRGVPDEIPEPRSSIHKFSHPMA
jgi:hypothetical protein